jgi:hypothetical protein
MLRAISTLGTKVPKEKIWKNLYPRSKERGKLKNMAKLKNVAKLKSLAN